MFDGADVEAIVLAGGLGTRLRAVLPDRPKVLADIDGAPFLDFLLDWLAAQGIRRVVLALGFRADDVIRHVAQRRARVPRIAWVVEPRPAGTAGAVALAARETRTDPVLVLNGDSFVEVDIQEFLCEHRRAGAVLSMVCADVPDTGRYGRLDLDPQGGVARFVEKDPSARICGIVNAGCYAVSRAQLERIAVAGAHSLERDVLAALPAGTVRAYRGGAFIDIGTPASLASAAAVLAPFRRLGAGGTP